MPVAADLKLYASANMPEDDTSISGGAIDLTTEVEFTPMAANDTIEAVSDNAADTMNLSVFGRNAAGDIVNETKALTGTTPISLTTLGTIERIEKMVLASAAAGTVTVRRATGPVTIKDIAAGITTVRRMFYDSASEAGATTRYEKVFFKNTHATESLTSAQVTLTADPAATIQIGVAATKDDTGSVANRKTSPGVTFYDDGTPVGVPTGSLAAGEAIGVWAELARGAGAAAIKSTYTVQLSGNSV